MVSWRSKAKTQLERFYGDGCVWSLVHDEEMVIARKRRQQGKQPLDEETTRPKRDLDMSWVEEWPTDDIHLNETNLFEFEYERAFVNDSLPVLLETKQRFFLDSLICYRMNQYPVLSYVMSPAQFWGVRTYA